MDYFFIYFAMACLIAAVLLTETKHIIAKSIFALLFLSSIITHFVINPFEIYNQINTNHFPIILLLLLIILFIALVLKLQVIIEKNTKSKCKEKRNTHD